MLREDKGVSLRMHREDKGVSARECVWRIVTHDVKELRSTLHGESVRFVGTLHQIAVDETRRLWRQVDSFQQHALDEAAPARSEDRLQITASSSTRLESSDEGFSGTLARVYVALFAQHAALVALIDSYVHWRWPLLSWWVLSETTVAFAPVATVLGRLFAEAESIATAAAVGIKSGEAPADPEPPLNLHEALLHMRPQIVAKIRHTIFHDPLSACTFAAVAARLLLIWPLFQIAKLIGEGTRTFRQKLQRLALREAMLASARCNRVELRMSLPPPTRPRHAPHAFETQAQSWIPRWGRNR
jgi:hypothetical protein